VLAATDKTSDHGVAYDYGVLIARVRSALLTAETWADE
jgi:hypothetical protein